MLLIQCHGCPVFPGLTGFRQEEKRPAFFLFHMQMALQIFISFFSNTDKLNHVAQLSAADGVPVVCAKFCSYQVNAFPCLAFTKGTSVYVWKHSINLNVALSVALPQKMAISALIWNTSGNEIITFSLDGHVSTIAWSDNSTLEIVDDLSALISHTILSTHPAFGQSKEAAVGSSNNAADNEEAQDESGGDSIRFSGAVASANGLYQALFYYISTSDLEYMLADNNFSYVMIWHNNYGDNTGMEISSLTAIRKQLGQKDIFFSQSPTYLLWDLMQYCCSTLDFQALLQSTISVDLQQCYELYYADTANGLQYLLDSDPSQVFQNIVNALFQNRALNSLRCLNLILHTLLPSISDKTFKVQVTSEIVKTSRILLGHYLQLLVHATKIHVEHTSCFQDSDILMFALISDLCMEQKLCDLIPIVLDVFQTITQSRSSQNVIQFANETMEMLQSSIQYPQLCPDLPHREVCLACEGPISFKSAWKAICIRGHSWERCALTFLSAATPVTASCKGCNTKSLTVAALHIATENSNKFSIMSIICNNILLCNYCGATRY